MKQTRQKQAVLDTVLNMTNHPTAEEVYKEVCKVNHEIGIATVYRNLNSFAKEGLIRKVSIPNAADRFDFQLKSHEHFLCKKCGRVFDANVEVKITPKNGTIHYNGYTLTLFGVCAECEAAK